MHTNKYSSMTLKIKLTQPKENFVKCISQNRELPFTLIHRQVSASQITILTKPTKLCSQYLSGLGLLFCYLTFL